MSDRANNTNTSNVLSPSPQSGKRSREEAGLDSRQRYILDPRSPTILGNMDVRRIAGDVPWPGYPAIPSLQPHTSQDTQLPTPQSFGTDKVFPFFPTAVSSPESPLAYARSRTLGGASGASLVPRIQSSMDPCNGDSRSQKDSAAQPHAITPRASPVISPSSFTARPISLPVIPSPSQEHPVFVKTESPPPELHPAHSSLAASLSQALPSEDQKVEISLSSPFVEKPKSISNLGSTSLGEPFPLHATNSPSTSILTQPIVLSSPAHIKDKQIMPAPNPSDDTTGGPSRLPGGELDRIRNHLLEAEETRRAELESRRPEYLKRFHGDDIGSSAQKLEDKSTEKNSVAIMETPARGRRLQLFDFQETSAESFEESLMTHGYGTYGEPRTPQRPLAATEMLSKEAMDWLAYNTPAAVPSSSRSHLVPDSELNEKELKKRKRLEAFRGSTARAYAKLFPAEVEGLGRIILNVPPEEVDELVASPAKKRAAGRKKRGAAAAEKKNRMQLRSTPVRAEGTEPRWLDKEVPWSLREKEREEEMKAQDAERMRWIDSYFAHDTTDEDSDKNEEDRTTPTWDQELEEVPDVPRRGRGKAVPLQANPNRKEVPPSDNRKGRSLFFPTDPADARTALMSKRNVRLLAHRKMRQNGQRPASLRGYGDGKLACACGQDEDDGRPAVQCDDCYNWHHLECIGVEDERELGEEDDPWFCPDCTLQAEAAAAEWRNRPQPTFVPTDERPVHTSTKSDVAFYSSSPLRDWGSSGSLHTPLQGTGRLHGGSTGSSRRSIWDDPHSGGGPSTPLTMTRGAQIYTPGTSQFDPMISPRSSFSKFGTSFTTPKNATSVGATGGSVGFGGLLWPPQSSGGLFSTPTAARGRGGGSNEFGFNYGSDDPALGVNVGRGDVMYAVDDTPIRRAPVKEMRTLGMSGYPSGATGGMFSIIDSPLSGRGGGQGSGSLEVGREVLRASVE